MYDKKSTEGISVEKSTEGMCYKKSAEGLCDKKAAVVDKLATHKTVAVKGDQCQTRFVARIEELARDVLTRDQSQREENKTDRKKKLPRHEALSPSGYPEDSRGVDIAEYPVVFLPCTLHVLLNRARGPGQPALGRSVVAEQS